MAEQQLYVRVGEGKAERTDELDETANVLVDFKEGKVIGIEILDDYRLFVGDKEITAKRAPADHLIVRKEHVLCTVCKEMIPINPGHGTPASTFIMAIDALLIQHPAKPHGSS
jgi:uncharacterized protein YuzE